MTKPLLLAAIVLTAPLTLVACDSPDTDEGEVVTKQLQNADVLLEDALAAVDDAAPEAIVIEAEFLSGVDVGYYALVAVDGEDLVTFEVDGRRPTAREVARRRAEGERLNRARAHRHARRRLAAALAELGGRRGGERVIRARLLAREAEVDLRDRRGNERRILHALAD